MSEEKVRISVRVNEEEKKKIEYLTSLCGLSQAEYLRQICIGRIPNPKPPKDFWLLMDALYEVHSGFKKCGKYEPSALVICKEIEQLIIDLQTHMIVPQEVISYGNNKPVAY